MGASTRNKYMCEAFHVNCPSAVREPQMVLFSTHIYDTKMYFKKLFDK